MILFRIATGFYIWDVYKWLSVFLFTAFAAALYISLCVRRRGGRLAPEKRGDRMDSAGAYPIERFGGAFVKVIMDPWEEMPSCGLIALAVFFIFFVVAIFAR